MFVAIIFLGLGLVFVTGVGFVLHGRRGRRIDNHRVCAKCRYDLHGLPHEDAALCPECGAKLTRPKATRVGNRQPRNGFLWAGVVLVLLGLVGVVGIGIPIAQGYDWLKIQPVWMLVDTAGDTNAPTRAAAAQQELLKRYRARELTPNHFDRIIKEALARQADRSIPWDYFWGDMVEIGRVEGYVSDDQWRQFITEASAFELVFKPTIREGDSPVFQFQIVGSRRTATSANVNTWYIHDKDDKAVFVFEGDSTNGDPIAPVRYVRRRLRAWDTQVVRSNPERLSIQGSYSVSTTVSWMAYDMVNGIRTPHVAQTAPISYNATYQVVDPSVPYAPSRRGSELRDEIAQTLYDPSSYNSPEAQYNRLVITARRFTDSEQYAGMLIVHKQPLRLPAVGLCHSVWIRCGVDEVEVGSFAKAAGGGYYSIHTSAPVSDRFFSRLLEQGDSPRVDLILRPAPSLMANKIHPFTYLDEEIVVTDVPVVFYTP